MQVVYVGIAGEKLQISENISITIVAVRGENVRLEIQAPEAPRVIHDEPDDIHSLTLCDEQPPAAAEDSLSESRFFPECA